MEVDYSKDTLLNRVIFTIIVVSLMFGIGALFDKYKAPPKKREVRISRLYNLPEDFAKKIDLNDQVFFINYFSSWCEHCNNELPYIQELKEKYGYKIIGVVVWDKKENVEAVMDNYKDLYHKILFEEEYLKKKYFNMKNIPRFVIVYNNQVILDKTGAIDEKSIINEIFPVVDKINQEIEKKNNAENIENKAT
jgi:thiol-disulfide isomerase/thioredoxin